MLDRTILLPVMLFAGVCCCGVSAGVPADGSGRDGVYGTLLIDGSVSPEVTPVEYGFHYEEIGMMGEGALHAELVRNRSFEEATPPADLSVRNGLYQDVPAPRGKNKKVYRADPLTGWLTFPVSYSPVRMGLTDEKPLNGANTYSLEVEVTPDIADYGEAAIVNKGYFGMNLKKGTGYRLSFFVRSGGKPGRLEIYLTDSGGHRISRKYPVDFSGEEWSRKELLISAVKDDPRGMLAIHPATGGKFYLDMVSLMPEDTSGQQQVFATMGYDSAAGEYVLKLLNISDKTMILDTEVSGFPGKVDADVCLLDLSIRKDNTPADPGCVAPVRYSCRLDLAGHIEVAPLSLAIYRFK